MGYFGMLSLEVRLHLWRDIITSGSPAILQTSRAINDDISYPLYHTLNFSIYPDWDAPRLKMHSPILDAQWVLQQRDGLRRRKRFWKLSYNRSFVGIDIFAPNTQDPGQIILLWKRVSGLVEMLNKARYDRKSIKIRLHPFHGNNWHRDGVPTQTMEYPGGVSRPDYQIVFLPFCRLIRARKIEVTAPSGGFNKPARHWRFVKYGCDFIMNDGYEKSNDGEFSRKRRYRDITRMFDNVDGLVVDTDFWLETQLDRLDGRTANMLRLERFANWFNRLRPTDSHYQRKCLLAIRHYPQVTSFHDKWLRNMRQRLEAVKYLCYTVKEPTHDLVYNDPQAWYKAHPLGIDTLTKSNIQRWKPGRWTSQVKWPGHNPEFDRDIKSFVLLNVRNSHRWRRIAYVRKKLRWCFDCADVGFWTGCEHGCEVAQGLGQSKLRIQYVVSKNWAPIKIPCDYVENTYDYYSESGYSSSDYES